MRGVLAGILCVLAFGTSGTPLAPSAGARLAAHARVLDPPNAVSDSAAVARYIETVLAQAGYEVSREVNGQEQRIEAGIAGTPAPAAERRTFIIGANYIPRAARQRTATAAVIELARLLKTLHPASGTDIRFVFFVRAESAATEHAGDFIAFQGSPAQSRRVRSTLASFRAASTFPQEGLATPAYAEGVTVAGGLMITDAEFLRYPYLRAAQEKDQADFDGMAQAVASLARLLARLAASDEA
jgi:hypothetical protein